MIVPTKTDPVSYAYYLKQNGFINNNVNLEKLAEHFKGEANIQVIFNRLNNNLSPELRAKKRARLIILYQQIFIYSQNGLCLNIDPICFC